MTDGADGNAGPALERRRAALLLLVAAAAGVLMIAYGSVARIEYDGWWHVFIARASGWRFFFREVYSSAHPPLYYLLLKLATAVLGASHLAYRSVNILGGMVSVVLIGLIAGRIYRDRFTAILVTAVFATCGVTVIIANEVRSYMLAGTMVLVAMVGYLNAVEPEKATVKPRLVCSLGLTLGLLSHYSVLFVLVAFAATPVLLVIADPGYRHRVLSRSPQFLLGTSWMLAVPSVVALEEYRYHIRGVDAGTAFNYIEEFFYQPGERLVSFVGRVLFDELDLFIPADLLAIPKPAQVLIAATVVAGFVALLVMLRRERGTALVIPLLTASLVAVMLVVSVLGKYPFGGRLRHQYLVFPFALMTCFLLLDRIVIRVGSPPLRRRLKAVLLVLSVAGVGWGWARHDIPRVKLGDVPHRLFRNHFPDASDIAVDQFSLIYFFSHEHDAEWFVGGAVSRRAVDQIRVRRDDTTTYTVWRQRKWQTHLDDPKTYSRLRSTMRKAELDRIVVYHLERVRRGQQMSAEMKRERRQSRIARLAGKRHLAPVSVVANRTSLFVELESVE